MNIKYITYTFLQKNKSIFSVACYLQDWNSVSDYSLNSVNMPSTFFNQCRYLRAV